MFENVSWIKIPEQEYENKKVAKGDLNGRFAYFRCCFEIDKNAVLEAAVSANSRYRLWVNERPVLSGPCRGDRWYTYYDQVDLSKYLVKGKNVIAVQVVLFDESTVLDGGHERAPIYSVVSHSPLHLLAMRGQVTDGEGNVLSDITTGAADWKVSLENSFYLVKGNEKNIYLGAMSEHIDCRESSLQWKQADYDDAKWLSAAEAAPACHDATRKLVGLMDDIHLYPRPIPLLYEQEAVKLTEQRGSLFENGSLEVGPGEKRQFLFTTQVHMNGYLQFLFEKGAGAKITISCFEKFYSDQSHVKRDDDENGAIYGEPQTDTLILNGKRIVYEPFWYRTVRFLQLEVETAGEPVILYTPQIRKTGYPLNPVNQMTSSKPWVSGLWEICVRTLENCMMDGYMDCPFWEQMQYPMDTRLQALFTYACSRDYGLIKKALWEFHCSLIPSGLIQGKAPSCFPQVISTFSLHYIFMIRDYIDHTGGVAEAAKYISDIDGILNYYERHKGKSTGMVGHIGYWPFVDWRDQWPGGIPSALAQGPSTVINLMYAYALGQAADICDHVGRAAQAEAYRSRKDAITEKVQSLCYDPDKQLYREGPEVAQYSQHAQSWAVLCGMCSREQAAALMKASYGEDVIQCSFSTSYELFRACEWAGCYELTFSSLKRWIDLLEEHCTTCPETPDYDTRSECHAWSALPMYELIYAIGGIHEEKDGSIRVSPKFSQIDALPDISGTVAVAKGTVKFSYEKKENRVLYRVELPEQMCGRAECGDGREIALNAGINQWEVSK